MPHVQVHRKWSSCAYTMKDLKWSGAMSKRGHEVIVYGNEGSEVEGAELVQLLTEEERASFFGPYDRQKLIDLRWDANEPYWRLQAERAIPELKKRVKKGDFILSMSGNCHQPIANAFENCYSGTPTEAMWVEYGCGYYGVMSRYVVYESETHRSWLHGARDSKGENNDDAVVYNFFDLRDFVVDPSKVSDKIKRIQEKPYFLFIGRVIESKGFQIADEVTQYIPGSRLVVAGPGEVHLQNLTEDEKANDAVIHFGHATIEERAALMTGAIATIAPTRFREPFGGVAVEAQLCGCPAITTDHGAFVETTERQWRCVTHRDFVEACERAQKLTAIDRANIKIRAASLFSLEAVMPLYEKYFDRLYARWWAGYYEMRDLEALTLP
jgi:glycosyltransferase involved in cell wall biosynthesis